VRQRPSQLCKPFPATSSTSPHKLHTPLLPLVPLRSRFLCPTTTPSHACTRLGSILDVGNFEKYLKERIKVQGKPGNLGDAVTVGKDKSKIVVTADMAFSKRYLKYLAKKYLKKHQVQIPFLYYRTELLSRVLPLTTLTLTHNHGQGAARLHSLDPPERFSDSSDVVHRCVISCVWCQPTRQHTSSSITTSRRTRMTLATSKSFPLISGG